MKKNNLLTSLLGPAALLLMAATALVITSCSQDENEPGGTTSEGRIALVPTVAPTTAWSTADGGNAPGTRADATIAASLTGGEIAISISTLGADGNSAGTKIGCNYFSVSADGKLTRLPYNSGNLDETEAPLAVDAPGEYWVNAGGPVTLVTDGIEYGSYLLLSGGAKMNIAANGTFSLGLPIITSGLRLNVKNTVGTAYTGTDVTATLKTITAYPYGATFDVKTLTSAAPSAIWGDIGTGAVTAGTQLLELATGGKTYRVNAPRQITFTAARLYTFNVRIGATGITVSSDDLGIADFEAEPVTNAEAELPPAPITPGNAVWNVNGYWVTNPSADDRDRYNWDEANNATTGLCANHGNWRMPVMKDFEKMVGWTASNPWTKVDTNFEELPVLSDVTAWQAAFMGSTWSSDEHPSGGWCMESYGATANYYWNQKTEKCAVRCVQRIGGEVFYEGQPANLLAIPGQTAYWVAPVDAKNVGGQDSMTWAEAMAVGVCPDGWKVPTKDDFVAMTGLPADGNHGNTKYYDAIKAAFSSTTFYWSSTEYDATYAWGLYLLSKDILSVDRSGVKRSYSRVRCVKAK